MERGHGRSDGGGRGSAARRPDGLLRSGRSRRPDPAPYDGPLWIAPDPALDLWHDPGAAGRVVTCDQPVLGESSTTPFTGGRGRRDRGVRPAGVAGRRALAPASTATTCARADGARPGPVHLRGGRPGAAGRGHAPRARASRGPGAGADGIAWYVESSARCDVVEYPDGLAESQGRRGVDRRHRTPDQQPGRQLLDQRRRLPDRGHPHPRAERGRRRRRARTWPTARRTRTSSTSLTARACRCRPTPSTAATGTATNGSGSRPTPGARTSADRDRVDVWPRLTDGFGCG